MIKKTYIKIIMKKYSLYLKIFFQPFVKIWNWFYYNVRGNLIGLFWASLLLIIELSKSAAVALILVIIGVAMVTAVIVPAFLIGFIWNLFKPFKQE